jgi:type IX secretion system PorP/SprF family membrane protein
MNIFRHIALPVAMLVASMAHAQDIHFSQYYSAPLTINPALTGGFAGDYRAGANYRSQWASVTVPYRTFDIYGDLNLGRRFLARNFWSIGANVIADRAGDGDLSVTKFMASGAYHLLLDETKNHDFSFGLQAGWVQKSVDFSKFYFDNQWSDVGFDTGLPSGENFIKGNFGFADVAAGISYAYSGPKRLAANAGFSVFHLNRPIDSFYGTDNRLGMRPVFNAGISYKLSDATTVSPSVFYQSQKKAQEWLAGAMIRYNLRGSNDPYVTTGSLYAGLYGRFGDAFIPVIGYEYRNWRLLMNYDVNTSALKPATNGQGAFEISLVYTGTSKKNQGVRIDLPCPRF